MPRRAGTRGRQLLSMQVGRLAGDKLEGVYSEAFLDTIAREFRIPDGRPRAELTNYAARAAAAHHDHKILAERQATPDAVVLAAEVQRMAEQIRQDLDMLLYAFPTVYLDALMPLLEQQTGLSKEEIHFIIVDNIHQFGDESTRVYISDDYAPILNLIVRHCEGMIPGLRPPRGRKLQMPVYGWAMMLCDYWEKVLGREVTVYVHEGRGQSEVYHFLAASLEPLDPSAKRYLTSVLRRERTNRRRRRRR